MEDKFIMNKNMFARFIQNCDRTHFKDIALEKDGKLIPLKKMLVSKDSKRIYFIGVDEKDSCNYYRNHIVNLEMLNTNRYDFDYSFLITIDNGKSIKVHINMKDGYSPYAYTDDVIQKYSKLENDLTNFLNSHIHGDVIVYFYSNTCIYRTVDENNQIQLPLVSKYVIPNFSYEIFHDNIALNIPCIELYSHNSILTSAVIMGICDIKGNKIITDIGEYVLEVIN